MYTWMSKSSFDSPNTLAKGIKIKEKPLSRIKHDTYTYTPVGIDLPFDFLFSPNSFVGSYVLLVTVFQLGFKWVGRKVNSSKLGHHFSVTLCSDWKE